MEGGKIKLLFEARGGTALAGQARGGLALEQLFERDIEQLGQAREKIGGDARAGTLVVSERLLEGRSRTVTIGNARVLSRAQTMDVARRVLLRSQTGDNPAEERKRLRKVPKASIKVWM